MSNSKIWFPVVFAVTVITLLFAITVDYDVETSVQNISKTKITDVVPNTTFGGSEASIQTLNISDVKDDVVYTIEGIVLEFGQPIEYLQMK